MRHWETWLLTVSPHQSFRSASKEIVLQVKNADPGWFAIVAENKLLIVRLGGLEPLIRQMLSPNVEVQCNAVGCITNLATHGKPAKNLIYRAWAETLYFDDIADENKTKIAKSGALVPLTRLAKSKDMRVQRNATGALLNMTHSGRFSLDICMV